jgi:cellulose biosynthesis protein BcsQ
VLILSGKGGVGKSTVTANLARCLALNQDLNIGILGTSKSFITHKLKYVIENQTDDFTKTQKFMKNQ